MKCDIIATGVVAAAKEVGLKVPLVVRLEGTNVELGKKTARRERPRHHQPPTTWPTRAKKVVRPSRPLEARGES